MLGAALAEARPRSRPAWRWCGGQPREASRAERNLPANHPLLRLTPFSLRSMATAKKDLVSKKRLFVKNGLRDAELNEVRERLLFVHLFWSMRAA